MIRDIRNMRIAICGKCVEIIMIIALLSRFFFHIDRYANLLLKVYTKNNSIKSSY